MRLTLPQFQVAAQVKSLHKGNGLYIHIPFCSKKCAYCSFYSGFQNDSLIEDYVSALIKELEKWGGRFDRPIDSIYFGGGTPSLLGEKIESIIDAVRQNFNVLSDAEITAEINPEASLEFLKSAKISGINRISMGIQSGNDDELKVLGRSHTVSEARDKYYLLKDLGFDNISLDIMLGLPNSSIKTLDKSLKFIADLNPQHISAYILKIEEKTALYHKKLHMPSDDLSAEQYTFMCDYLKNKGYKHYEISNFCKDGFESRHNLKYWEMCEYLGIGPSAHSMIDNKRFYYPSDLRGFINNPKTVDDGVVEPYEKLMLGLRINKGVTIDINNNALINKIKLLEKAGYVQLKGNNLSLTDTGMLLSNSIIAELI